MPRARALPSGTVTFLFTDIEGSTRLWEAHPEAMRAALARHDALLRAAIETHGGCVFKTIGDAFCAAFATAPDALAASLEAQRALHAEPWGEFPSLRVRMALHTGAAQERDADYLGPPLNRVARLLEVAHGGQTLLSLATEQLVRESLPHEASLRDLGVHRLKDLQQPEHLFQLLHPALPTDFPPLRSLETVPNNLPQQVTSFIGREREIAEVKRLLESARLLTLTGVGGTGKTRLVLQVAADLLQGYPDGVWLVELAPLADPALVPQTVASNLSIREEPGRLLTQTLVAALKSKRLLLLFDNCEHLLEACAALADALLRGCPGVQILATSREGLNIPGEVPYRLGSLSVPDIGQGSRVEGQRSKAVSLDTRPLSPDPDPSVLLQYEAVHLFLDRAATVAPSFRLTAANAPAVAQICHRLDGIPLAIELAAARVKALPAEKLNERLTDMFRLLTGGSRTALPRQQTLRALIDWSYDLLTEAERALLRRLSVFAGGWTLEMAEAVCAFGASVEHEALSVGTDPLNAQRSTLNAPLEEWEVLDLLTSLVEKSLVLYEEAPPAGGDGGDARYRLLETVRQYARDRLVEAGEAQAVRGRHRDWFLALAERAGPALFGSEQTGWVRRLEREHDNLRAAMAWSVETGEAEAGLRMGGSLWRFWHIRDYAEEGRERLAALLAIADSGTRVAKGGTTPAGLSPEPGTPHSTGAPQAWGRAPGRTPQWMRARAQALDGAGVLAMRAAWDLGAARAHYEEMLAIGRELGDREIIAVALNGLGHVALGRGDGGRARPLFEQGLELAREVGHTWEAAFALHCLGYLFVLQGDYGTARPLLEESLAIRREHGDLWSVYWTLSVMAIVADEQGDYAVARALLEECAAICRELGRSPELVVLRGLAHVARVRGDFGAARARFEEMRAIAQERGHRADFASSLYGLGCVAISQGDFGTARTYFEESLVIGREMGVEWLVAGSLEGLGEAARYQGDDAAACSFYEECLAMWREPEGREASPGFHFRIWPQTAGGSLLGLGRVAQKQGNGDRAAALYREGLARYRKADRKPGVARGMEALGSLAVAQGQPARAARLFGAAEALREAAGAPIPAVDRAEYERDVAAARAALGEAGEEPLERPSSLSETF